MRKTVHKYAKFIVTVHESASLLDIHGQNCPQIRQIYGLSTNLSDFWTGLSTNMPDLRLLYINLAYLWAGLSTNLADLWTVHESVIFMDRTVHKSVRF